MATTQLRPMAMGEILDASFALLRRHAGVFFGVAIVCQGLPTALGLFVEFNGGARQHFGLYALSQLLSFIGYLLITGASIRVVSQAYLGNEPSLSDALDFAFSKLGRTLAAGFATGILVLLDHDSRNDQEDRREEDQNARCKTGGQRSSQLAERKVERVRQADRKSVV